MEYDVLGLVTETGCQSAIAIRWDHGLDGALAIVSSSGLVAFARGYPNASHLRAAGRNRVGFAYTRAHGAGYLEERFVILCSFGTAHWIECLDIEQFREMTDAITTLPWTGSRGLWVRYSGFVRLSGDSVFVRKNLEWALVRGDGSRGEIHERDLGTTEFLMP